jgi:CRISPR-associated DxTHG motif protein
MGKKLLTFLGTSDYDLTIYDIGGSQTRTKFIQQAIWNHIGKEYEVIIFLTNQAREKNWPLLQELLHEDRVKYQHAAISDGRNQQEIWDNFDAILSNIQVEDQLVVDITHSFRSLPLIFMSILQYAKFTKNIKVDYIYYGAFERGQDITPVFDLRLFVDIVDWSAAADKFIVLGRGEQLANLTQVTLAPILKKAKGADSTAKLLDKLTKEFQTFSQEIQISKGRGISNTGYQLKQHLEQLQEITYQELKPFKGIIKLLLERVQNYSGNHVLDVHETIKLCRDFNLFQQAYTLLAENIITYVCVEMGIKKEDFLANKKLGNSRIREISKNIVCSYCNPKVNLSDKEMEFKNKITGRVIPEIGKLYDEIGDYRNNTNHAGYQQQELAYANFGKKLGEFISRSEEIYINSLQNQQKKFLLVLSHELLSSQREEINSKYNNPQVIELPQDLSALWRQINPADELKTWELDKVTSWIQHQSKEGDYVLVQGEYGATYYVVNYCFANGRIPIYATTKRTVQEVQEGDKTVTQRVFEHVAFRHYPR